MSCFAVISVGCRPSRVALVMPGGKKSQTEHAGYIRAAETSDLAMSLGPLASPRTIRSKPLMSASKKLDEVCVRFSPAGLKSLRTARLEYCLKPLAQN